MILDVGRQKSDGFPGISGSQRSLRLSDGGGRLISDAGRLWKRRPKDSACCIQQCTRKENEFVYSAQDEPYVPPSMLICSTCYSALTARLSKSRILHWPTTLHPIFPRR